MKKLVLSLTILFLLVSCQENVKFNSPSLQGLKDNVFWRAVESKAILSSNGSLLIQGYTSNEILSLKITSKLEQTFTLGINELDKVTYTLIDDNGTTLFSTGLGIGDGQIVITEYDVVNHTVTGTFRFNAENSGSNPLAGPNLNFQEGVFYKVPVSSAP